MNTQNINMYKKTQLETGGPIDLILQLYDAAIRQLERGKSEIEEKRYEEKNLSLSKAKEIVYELLVSLDEEKGGSIAVSLSQLYNFVIREIIDADLNLNCSAIDSSLKILTELRESWNSINNTTETVIDEVEGAEDSISVSV
ncbi:MAG: flagellar export chaperone FliS [Planctomycetes bacterium]|nr:flagellar export chaperone FliS [Planctomycetota bacterium]